MKTLKFLFFLFFLNGDFLQAQKAFILINPPKNQNEIIQKNRDLFFKELKKQAKQMNYIFKIFNTICFKDNLNLERKENIDNLFAIINTVVNKKVESIEVICFEKIEEFLCYVTKRLGNKNLINRLGVKNLIKGIHIFALCENSLFLKPNFSVVDKIYNFYSDNLIIQGLTGIKICDPINGVDRRKIVNVKLDSAFGSSLNTIYEDIIFSLFTLSNYLDSVGEQDVIYKDKRIILPKKKRDSFRITSFDASCG